MLSRKVEQMIAKWVDLRNPLTLDIGEEVKLEQISGDQVTIYP